MENASKALIIAGAILLSILIITLGILIFQQAQDTINSVDMSDAEKTAFNNKFLPYEGENVRGSQVNALAQAVLTNNQSAKDNGESATKGVTVSGAITIAADGSTTTFTRVPSGTMYKVTFTYKDSMVNSIAISAKTGS